MFRYYIIMGSVCTRALPPALFVLVVLVFVVPKVTSEATMLVLQVLFLMWRLDGKVRGGLLFGAARSCSLFVGLWRLLVDDGRCRLW